ncbi:serine-threonine protein kinase 19-domain-containing protein [Corynascus novoguineensis]|uniref:Serine-threonine protein kinase 19-domain-containing protein n=1 Tax=Corynascus novoguineensis TaxID=1126955 RepID=A0AAN7HPF6_9PEZI|nr:serine-threonine protein kinase 19-domain-containing protein [Corynascus novoguineensis]
MTLHSVLGISRVKKRSSSSSTKRSSSSKPPSWTAALARTKPSTGTTNTASKLQLNDKENNTDNHHHRHTHQKLPDLGPTSLPLLRPPSLLSPGATTTAPTPITATPAQVHAHVLATMFSPLPGGGTGAGLGSARIATALRARTAVPRVVSVTHLLQALMTMMKTATMTMTTPAAAERAVAGMVRRGEGRRVRIPTLSLLQGRGGTGAAAQAASAELFVLVSELEEMVRRCEALSLSSASGEGERLGERFLEWLRRNPARERLVEGEHGFSRKEVDVLVRAGFLTAVNNTHRYQGSGPGAGLGARPEGRYRMVSLETVARAAAGSVAAAGGEGVLHAAGGTGARSIGPAAGGGAAARTRSEFSIAVPGSGVFLKLVSAALEHLADLLRKSQYREMSESDLREKWDGGVVGESEAALAKKLRGEFAGVMPGRTKKWKEFHGLSFDWVLREAVGAGMVEVFETQSVGRGVRLV